MQQVHQEVVMSGKGLLKIEETLHNFAASRQTYHSPFLAASWCLQPSVFDTKLEPTTVVNNNEGQRTEERVAKTFCLIGSSKLLPEGQTR